MTTTIKLPLITTTIIIVLGCWTFFTQSGDNVNFIKSSQDLSANIDVHGNNEKDILFKTQAGSKTIAVNTKYQVRFVSEEGGVSLFVNGFLVLSEESKGRGVIAFAPYIKPGVNTFILVRNKPGKNATINLVDVNDGGNTATAIPVLTLSNEDVKDASVIGNFTIDEEVLKARWHDASKLGNVAASAEDIYLELEALAKAMQNGSDEEIMSLLALKHKEIAASVGITKEDMDTGLLQGLTARRAEPNFSIDLVSREDFISLVSTNGTIANAMRKDGSDAIQIAHGAYKSEFRVALAKIEGEFVIVR